MFISLTLDLQLSRQENKAVCNTSFLRLTSFVVLSLLGFSARVDSQTAPLFKLIEKIPLPQVQGRIDHLVFDAAGDRLFVCALGNDSLEVIGLRTQTRVHSISGLGAPQGVAYAPEFDRLLVANDKGGICKIYDGKSFQELGKIDLKDDADNVRYDNLGKRFYVGFGNGGIAVIGATDGKQIGSIKLSAHPEAFALEKSGQRIFVNVPTSRHIAVIDREKGKVIATWQTDLAFGNFPIALDEASHRLFVGCRLPSRLIVLNTDSGEVIAKLVITGDPDDLFYDSKRHRIYAICGAGKVDIIEQSDANSYRVSNSIETDAGARTGLFVAELDKLFVALPRRGSKPAEIRSYKVE